VEGYIANCHRGKIPSSRLGEIVAGRTTVILTCSHLQTSRRSRLDWRSSSRPTWMFEAFDAVLAVDIGGTNIRAGLVQLNLKKSRALSKAKVWKFSLWRHGGEEDVKREQSVVQLGNMLKGLILAAERKNLMLAPFIGMGWPGVIEEDGSRRPTCRGSATIGRADDERTFAGNSRELSAAPLRIPFCASFARRCWR
jgi:hypothetical protein